MSPLPLLAGLGTWLGRGSSSGSSLRSLTLVGVSLGAGGHDDTCELRGASQQGGAGAEGSGAHAASAPAAGSAAAAATATPTAATAAPTVATAAPTVIATAAPTAAPGAASTPLEGLACVGAVRVVACSLGPAALAELAAALPGARVVRVGAGCGGGLLRGAGALGAGCARVGGGRQLRLEVRVC